MLSAFIPLTALGLNAALAAFLFTPVFSFGFSNHEEVLPVVMRFQDPAYLATDFFVNASAVWNPRTTFDAFLALLGRIVPLPVALYWLLAGLNWLTAILSSLAARQLYGPGIAAFIAPWLVGILYVQLGMTPSLYGNMLISHTLAQPCLLAAMLVALQRRLIAAACFSIVAAQWHPLEGLVVGWLIFAASTMATRRVSRQHIAALLILAIGSGLVLVPTFGQPHIPDSEFIYIIAYFRGPHHYLPTLFPLGDYLMFGVAAFLAAVSLRLMRNVIGVYAVQFFIFAGLLMFVLMIGGFFFVEIWPIRLWATVQAYRYTWLIGWSSSVLLAGSFAYALRAVSWSHRARIVGHYRPSSPGAAGHS